MNKLGTCGTCQCFQKNKLSPTGDGFCLRFPPQPVAVMTPRGTAVQMMAPAVGTKSPGCFEHIPIDGETKDSVKDELARKFSVGVNPVPDR